jgi:hypothetical protein
MTGVMWKVGCWQQPFGGANEAEDIAAENELTIFSILTYNAVNEDRSLYDLMVICS